jgi:hypothetical protein
MCGCQIGTKCPILNTNRTNIGPTVSSWFWGLGFWHRASWCVTVLTVCVTVSVTVLTVSGLVLTGQPLSTSSHPLKALSALAIKRAPPPRDAVGDARALDIH